MRTGKKLLTGMLLVLFIVFVAGCGKAKKTGAVLPEVRNSGTAIQWKYSDEADWRDLVALTELRGAAGENGNDGQTERTVSTEEMVQTEKTAKTA